MLPGVRLAARGAKTEKIVIVALSVMIAPLPPPSDIRLKRWRKRLPRSCPRVGRLLSVRCGPLIPGDIAQVGEVDHGINLYRYRYLWSGRVSARRLCASRPAVAEAITRLAAWPPRRADFTSKYT
jgi:hypothetical protein